jgi:hypothetical protein
MPASRVFFLPTKCRKKIPSKIAVVLAARLERCTSDSSDCYVS